MKIAIIGSGYVGLPTGVGFAELGNEVICIDQDPDKIAQLNAGRITLFEAGLTDLYHKNSASGQIVFTTSMKEGVAGADIVIIAVGTPPHPVMKAADMQYIYAAAAELANCLTGYTVVANKSTVPVGTGDEIARLMAEQNPQAQFDVVSLPEFLREGLAVHDFFNPDRIIVGAETEKAQTVIRHLYAPLTQKARLLFVKRRSSETIKYASNAFLAIKIQYINEMADFCEKVQASVYEVAQGMGLDKRIGDQFLNPGPGYGGSCFPKDTHAMAYMGRHNGVQMTLIEAAIAGNDARKKAMAQRIIDSVHDISHPNIAVLGLAFKGGTDDCRESPAIDIVSELLSLSHVSVTVYDPQAMPNARFLLGDKVRYASDVYEACQGADSVVILTEWDDFKTLDLAKIKQRMRHLIMLDFRHMTDAHLAEKIGFKYIGIGC